MTTFEDWVERLALSTGYRQLRGVYERMAADARATDDPVRLCASIDEAVLRLRRERARDEAELQEIQDHYEAFKEEQKGVFGWLRRHVPFTETRQQEKGHQEQVADRQAEILADNLYLARAQLLKESILPPAKRRLGPDADDWARRLSAEDATDRVRAYALALEDLGRELKVGQAFAAEVKADVDAFAKARFADDEDERWRKEDVGASRAQLGEVERVLQAKAALRASGVERLRALVFEELEERDPAYRTARARASGLQASLEGAEEIARRLDALREQAQDLAGQAARLEELDERRLALSREEGAMRVRAEAARRESAEAKAALGAREPAARAAQGALARAQAALDDARRAHEAHVASTGQVELPEGADFAASSPAAAALVRAQEALAAATAEHRAAFEPHAAARAVMDAALGAQEALRREREAHERACESLETEAKRVRAAAASGRAALAEGLRAMPDVVQAHVADVQRLGVSSALGASRDPFVRRARFGLEGEAAVPEGTAELGAAAKRLAELAEGARAGRAALERQLAETRRGLDAAWARRGRELLGEDLANTVL